MKLYDELIQRETHREWAFSAEEYDARLDRIRKRMAAAGLDALLLSSAPNQCWLTGYQTIMSTGYAIAVVPSEGNVVFHVPELDVPCVLLTGPVRDIEVFYWSEPLSAADQLAGIVKRLNLTRAAIGIEMGRSETFAFGAMDIRLYEDLSASLPHAQFRDATNLVQQERIRKTPTELDCMRRAGEFSALGTRASIAAAATAATEAEIVAAGYQAMIAAGCELMSIDPIIFMGAHGGWAPHTMYGARPVSVGDCGYLEYSGNHKRYNAPMMRTLSLGPPRPRVRELGDAAVNTVEVLLGSIRPGRTGDDVAREAKAALEPVLDWSYFHNGYGYAVGLSFPPTWTEAPVYIAEGSENVLEPGMTFHLPICVSVPGEFAVGFSETVVVTEDGCEAVTPGTNRTMAVVDR